MADFSYDAAGDHVPDGRRATTVVNLAGAAVSLALVAGIGVWGYKLVMRDVTGVPVVRALEGPMRVAPEDPGGEVALNTGLSVNTVAAEGEAGPPEDRLVLAPPSTDLTEEDLDVAPLAEADEMMARPAGEAEGPEQAPASAPAPLDTATGEAELIAVSAPGPAPSDDPNRPLNEDEILALADMIAAGTTPLTAIEASAAGADVVTSLSGTPEVSAIASSIPGVSRSLRPQHRPAVFRPTIMAEAEQTVEDVESAPSVDPAGIPTGTDLVQLGAYETEEIAQEEWVRLAGNFADYMDGKSQVVQRAESGGRVFYRLRAMGFADLNDARRFCSALVAEDAACIPVVVR